MPATVIFLGAGATKSCNGPLTSEILPNMLRAMPANGGLSDDSQGRAALIRDFLQLLFHVKPTSPNEHYPGLPLLMSLIDTALERRQSFHPDWDLDRISKLREAIEFGIFDHLEERLMKAPTNNHWDLFNRLCTDLDEPHVITTNYDLVADTAMMFLSQGRNGGGRFPDYRCQISSDFYRNETKRFGILLKLHGSLSWLYCRTCARLEIGASESRRFLTVLTTMVGPSLEASFSPDGAPCPVCATKLRPLLVAPTHLKNYRNPHILQVWYEAEQVLRKAARVVFVGYSLPDDDVEVVYLLKRSLSHLDASAITVVELDQNNPPRALSEHPTGRRYRTLFGDALRWHAGGLDAWMQSDAPGLI
jgi:hypothetical protein